MECSGEAKECIECIKRVLPNFQSDYTSDLELCEALSDGEILCSLLMELSNGRVSYDSSNSHVLARKNLVFFLNQCRDSFGLKEDELFEPDDLLSMSNPEKVVKTVLKLANRTSSTKEAETQQEKPRNSDGLMVYVVNEICNHEQLLIDKLELLLLYRVELLGMLSEWSEDLVQVVFKHIEQLYTVHKEMHAKLTALAAEGCEQFCLQLSALFAEMEPKLSIYIPYLCDLANVHHRMDTEFQKAPELRNQLYMLDSHFKGLGFRSLYESPIKQTTDYLQLFKRLQKTALMDMPEASKSVEEALIQVEDFLDRLNILKRQADHLSTTKVVLAQLSNLPADLGNPEYVGLHLMDDIFKVRTVKDRKADNPQQSLCILTTKKLIVATKPPKKDSQVAFAFSIPIVSSLQARKCERGGGIAIALENGDKVTLEESKPKCHGLDKLKKLIDEAKAANFPVGWNVDGHVFALMTFPEGAQCSCCHELLAGHVMQGYGCSHCGKQLHLRCLRQESRSKPRRASAPGLSVARSASEFYHKNLRREKAEEMLAKGVAGTFLLRDCSIGGKALSVKTEKRIEHINIVEANGKCGLGNKAFWFDGLDELLDFYRKNKLSIHFSHIGCSLSDGILSSSAINGLKGLRHQCTLK